MWTEPQHIIIISVVIQSLVRPWKITGLCFFTAGARKRAGLCIPIAPRVEKRVHVQTTWLIPIPRHKFSAHNDIYDLFCFVDGIQHLLKTQISAGWPRNSQTTRVAVGSQVPKFDKWHVKCS